MSPLCLPSWFVVRLSATVRKTEGPNRAVTRLGLTGVSGGFRPPPSRISESQGQGAGAGLWSGLDDTDDVAVTVAGGQAQGGVAVVVVHVHQSTGGDEQAGHLDGASLGGVDQRGVAMRPTALTSAPESTSMAATSA